VTPSVCNRLEWPFDFRVTSSGVQVRLGRWVVRHVALGDVARADVVPLRRVPFWNEHWCNFAPARFVVLRRKTGWVRNFVINPADPAGFLEALRREAPRVEQGPAP
jgi:hypothetical protein